MLFNLSDQNSIANHFISELRDVSIQKDRLRFRKTLKRLGQIMAYEISKKIAYQRSSVVETPAGTTTLH
jgi:uracil phosphoribosyltransferase